MPRPKIMHICPGVGQESNLSNSYHGNCVQCNARLPLDDEYLMTIHYELDILSMHPEIEEHRKTK